MRNRLLLLLGLFLGSLVPAVAQTPAPWNVLAQEHVAPIITMLPTVSTPLPAASFLLSKGEKSNARFSLMFAGAYKRDHSLEHLLPMNEVKTLTLTRSSLRPGHGGGCPGFLAPFLIEPTARRWFWLRARSAVCEQDQQRAAREEFLSRRCGRAVCPAHGTPRPSRPSRAARRSHAAPSFVPFVRAISGMDYRRGRNPR